MLIAGLNKTTLLDYPEHVAAAVFVGGCNFRCPFCHNAEIVLAPLTQKLYTVTEIIAFLEKRKNILKGVCITGGEPTCQADLPELIGQIKALGYRVKLDTNGYAPEMLKSLLKENLLDYVAMDIKNCPEKYPMTVGVRLDKEKLAAGESGGDGGHRNFSDSFQIGKIEESVSALKESGIRYEFRTTVVKEFHTKEDLLKIADWIKGCPLYFLQQYRKSGGIIYAAPSDGNLGQAVGGPMDIRQSFHGYGRREMEDLAQAIRQLPGMSGKVLLRGIE